MSNLEWATVGGLNRFFNGQAATVSDGGVQVVWIAVFFLDRLSDLVCLADDLTSFDACSRQHRTECSRMMVPSGVLVDFRSSSEFSAQHDHCFA